MTRKIQITAGSIELSASLEENPTAQAVWDALPVEGNANVWGDEIYFSIPVELETSGDARQEMAVGELGYWPSGRAFCIFFGPTPVSIGEEPRAYTDVNPFGQIQGDPTVLTSVQNGEPVRVSKFE
jgi:hypothetical protein